MYKVQISFSLSLEETFGFMFNKDGCRILSELPCSIAKRWGHESYDLEAGIKAFLYMYGAQIGFYTIGETQSFYDGDILVSTCRYIKFDELPESLEYYYDPELN